MKKLMRKGVLKDDEGILSLIDDTVGRAPQGSLSIKYAKRLRASILRCIELISADTQDTKIREASMAE